VLIDIHHHYVPLRFVDLVRRDPARWQAVVYRDPVTGLDALATGVTEPPHWPGPGRLPSALDPGIFDLDVRLQEMDDMGLDLAALSVMPNLFYYFAPAPLGAEVAAVLNDAIHEACARHPSRLIPMGAVPLQDPAAAIAELERVHREYGFTAIEIAGSVNGANFDEPQFDPFFQRAAELDMLLFVHPASAPAPDRMRRYYTANLIGFPVETGICAAALIFGGTLARYPNLKVCLAHGGGITASVVGRWDHGWEARAEAHQAIERPPSEYFAQLYFDDLVHSPRVLRALLDAAGPDHVVVGTDYPFDMGERHPAGVLDALQLAPQQRAAIESETAARLLRLPPEYLRAAR